MLNTLLAAADVDPAILFVLAVAAFVCGAITVVISTGRDIHGWGLTAIGLAGMLAWWP